MATLFNTKISVTYPGLFKTIDNAAITASLKELTDGSGNQSGLYVNTAGDFKVSNILEWGSLKDTGTGVTITRYVTSTDGIENFDNNTSLPTSAAVKLYVDSKFATSDTLQEVLSFGNTTGGNDIVVSASDDITFTDTSKILMGASSDLQIYHDGSNSYINEVGTGFLKIWTNDLEIQSNSGTETLATFATNGAVSLYYDDSKKFETTTTGVTITGRLSGLTDPTLAQDATTKSYVDALDAGSDLDITDGTTAGAVNLNTQSLSILGTTNEIDSVVSGQSVTIGLPTSISTNLVGSVTGNLTGNVTGDLTGTVTSTSVLADGVTATTQASSDDSTKVATTAYVKSLDNASDLDFSTNNGNGAVNLNTQSLQVLGTTNQIITTAGSNQNITLSFPTAGVTLPDGSVATTQSALDNSTKVATTSYVDTSAALYLPLAGGTMTGSTIHNDSVKSLYGTGSDAEIYHDGSDFYAKNTTGNLYIDQAAVTESIFFRVSDANALDVTALTISRNGDLTTGRDVTIAGDLTVNGTTTTVNSQTLAVVDPLIQLAKDNTANSLDIGLYGDYNDGTDRFLGLFSDASDGNKFKLFKGTTVEPTTTVNIGGTGYVAADLQVAGLEATTGVFSTSATVSGALPLLYLTNTTSGTGKNWRLSSATNGKFFISEEGVVDAITLEHTSGNASFAGNVESLGTGNNLFTGNVGIGSSPVGNPATRFLAVGTAGSVAGGIQLWAGTAQTHFLQFGDVASGTGYYKGAISYAHSSDTLELLQNAVTALSFTGSQAATFAGNVTLSSGFANLPAGTEADPSLIFAGDDDTGLWHPASNTLAFSTFGSERLRIDSGGRVGVGFAGATIPVPLAVKDNQDSSFNSGLGIQRSANTQTGYINMVGGAMNFNSPSIPITFRQAGTVKASIESSGNVTLNSATALDFQVADFAQIKFRESGAIMIDSDNDQSSRNFAIKDGDGTNLLLITDTGNSTFTGDITISNSTPILDFEDTDNTNSNWRMEARGSFGGFFLQSFDNNFQTGSTVLFAKTSNGYIGLGGNTNPQAELDITGGLITSGNVDIGKNESTATLELTIGQGRTGNGFSFIDLVGDATYTDYGLRMLRGNGGANALSILEHRGTGAFEIKAAEAAPIIFETTGTERLRITAQGEIYNADSVGPNNNTYYGHFGGYSLTSGTGNTTFGSDAGPSVTTGIGNNYFGNYAGQFSTTGSYNVAIGQEALKGITVGSANVAIGRAAGTLGDFTETVFVGALAGYQNTQGSTVGIGNEALKNNTSVNNTAVGHRALIANTSGDSNTGLGFRVLDVNETGNNNTAVGSEALRNTTGGSNVAVGTHAGLNLSNANENTFLGTSAGRSMTTGQLNVAIGSNALRNSTTDNHNIAIGRSAMQASTSGSENVAIGTDSLEATSGTGNVAVGYRVGIGTSQSGNFNTLIGHEVAQVLDNGDQNVVIGRQAGFSLTNGAANVTIGYQSMYANSIGSSCVAVGWRALHSDPSSEESVAVGDQALLNQTEGRNHAFGFHALKDLTIGTYNTAVGGECLENITTGLSNVGIGAFAGRAETTGSSQIFIGREAGKSVSNASPEGSGENVIIGHSAAPNRTGGTENVLIGSLVNYVGVGTGSNNTVVGRYAGAKLTSASGNTFLGHQCGAELTTGTNNTLLGKSAGDGITTGVQNICIGSYTETANVSDSYCIVISTDQDIARGSSTGLIAPNGGNVFQDNNSANWATTSDERIKKNIVDNNIGLEIINKIQIRNFEYRTADEITDFENPKSAAIKKKGIQLGVIAQEIEKILPETITEESTGVKTVNSDNLTWYLINAVKELTAKVEILEKNCQCKN